MTEPHDVVKLLIARMESYPEEFGPNGSGRWEEWLDQLMPFVTEAERVLLRGPMMQGIHEEVLDELLNGEERRRKYQENFEYEQQMITRGTLAQQQAQQNALGQLNAYRNIMGVGAVSPSQGLTISSGGTGATPLSGSLNIGGETLDANIIKKIKGALGI